jgi:bifunctional enzyme CysN/CysC
VRAQVPEIRYRLDVNTPHRERRLASPSTRSVGFTSGSGAAALDAYTRTRATGSFILIDPVTNATVGAGMILFRQRRRRRAEGPTRPHRARLGGEPGLGRRAPAQRSRAAVWLTGPPRSGKSTLAYQLDRRLFDDGRPR